MQDVYSPTVLDLARDPGIRGILFQRELESEVGCYHSLLTPIQVWIWGLGEHSVYTTWRALFKKEHKTMNTVRFEALKEQLRVIIGFVIPLPQNRVRLLLGVEPKDTAKPKIRRKDLFLAASKEDAGDLSQSNVSLNCKAGGVLS